MFKMAITQTTVKIRIFSLFSIKKLFKLNLNKLVVFFTLFLFSCSSHIIKAEEVKPENLKCGDAYQKILNGKSFITSKDKDFKKNFLSLKLEDGINLEDFNLLIASDYKPTPGYDIKIDKIIKNNTSLTIFYEVNRNKLSSLQVITYPFCLLKIKNLDKFKVFLKVKK